jgi:hypothetical protein
LEYPPRRQVDTIKLPIPAFLAKERVIAKQQNTVAKKMREQDQKQKSNEKRLKRQVRKDIKATQSA